MSIQVKGITHIYSQGLPDESLALNDVSFEIEDESFAGIIGHTGSGKSTLLQHLNGLLKPCSGSIIINGTDITAEGVAMRNIRRKIGLVFQYPEYQLFEETIFKDVAFGPGNLGLSEEEIESRVKEAVKMVGLDYEDLKERSPFDLSGGQKRRIAIAGVIAMKPEVLILDEPTAGLDPKAHKDVLDMVKMVHRQEKNTTILVSHNMNDIACLCDQVLVMENGSIVMDGAPKEIFSQGERLRKMGLGLPDVTQLMLELKNKGFSVDAHTLTMDEAEQQLFNILKGTDR